MQAAGERHEIPDLLRRYAAAVRSSPHNLLSAKGLTELESRHIPESVTFAEGLPGGSRLLDVGSGGGLPGVVIAIMRREFEVHLLEATGKKARFLTDVCNDLALPVHVHHGRAEDLAVGPLAAAFDVVTARAVAPLARLITWCAPYLAPGGTLHAIKGERWAAELEDAGDALRQARLVVAGLPEVGLEGGQGDGGSGPKVVVLERPK
jgi:16S rRNA (guanine527-N7)-methyltransferase